MTDPITYPRYQAASGWNALPPARQARTAAPEERHFEAVVIGAGVTGLASRGASPSCSRRPACC